jgi:hypothetical protein
VSGGNSRLSRRVDLLQRGLFVAAGLFRVHPLADAARLTRAGTESRFFSNDLEPAGGPIADLGLRSFGPTLGERNRRGVG